jgi:hypothetical protein
MFPEIFPQQTYIPRYLIAEYNERDYMVMIDPKYRDMETCHQMLFHLKHPD